MKSVTMKGEDEKTENKKVPQYVTERIFGVVKKGAKCP
jgi:hypothetical protein